MISAIPEAWRCSYCVQTYTRTFTPIVAYEHLATTSRSQQRRRKRNLHMPLAIVRIIITPQASPPSESLSGSSSRGSGACGVAFHCSEQFDIDFYSVLCLGCCHQPFPISNPQFFYLLLDLHLGARHTSPQPRLSEAQAEMAAPTEVSSNKMFGGFNKRYKHESKVLGCSMNFSIYFPPAASSTAVPVLYWLSGLSCTDENFIMKSGGQRSASTLGVAIICPDTSPRGLNVEGQADSWDFGVGAGFYLNATEEKWKNWQMYDYITEELPSLLKTYFKQLDISRAAITGHSMGGHGALTIFLKNPTTFKSVSAFAPVANPIPTLWGAKAFTGYLGEDKSSWKVYDATELVKEYKGPATEILIDQGDKDQFYLEKRLLPKNFKDAAESAGVSVILRMQGGYDHSYYFIATFIDDHIKFHAKALCG